jgi:AraC-like DNA-binding protein
MGMKADRFAHDCTRLLGAPPRKAHLHYRLDHARSRLLTDDRPIAEISEDFGFASPFDFSRAFRSLFGYPPSKLCRGTRA